MDDVISSKEPVQRADGFDVDFLLHLFPKVIMELCRAREEQIIDVDCQQQALLREPEQARMIRNLDSSQLLHYCCEVLFPMCTGLWMPV